MFLTKRPYGVHPISAGQFPVRWGAGGAQCGAPLHCLGIPKPHHPMAKGWSAITCRLPLDATHNRPHHIRPEAWGQRQLHLWGHKQLWLQRGDRSPQCHRWVKDWREYSRLITYQQPSPSITWHITEHHWSHPHFHQKSEMDTSNECDVRLWTGAIETSFRLQWLNPGHPQPTVVYSERELNLQGWLVPCCALKPYRGIATVTEQNSGHAELSLYLARMWERESKSNS